MSIGTLALVEFRTYSCINCIHVMPSVKRYVEAAVKRFGIEYAVAQDNGYRTWNVCGNRYWPALYLVDRRAPTLFIMEELDTSGHMECIIDLGHRLGP